MTAAVSKYRPRIAILDEIRGFSILAMVAYHITYDLVQLDMLEASWFRSPWMHLLRDIFAGIFILISGLCCLYSKNNLKRGVYCFLAGILVEWVTSFFPGSEIRFGILHLLGSCMVLFALAEPLFERIPEIAGFVACIPLFFLSRGIPSGEIRIPFGQTIALPESWSNGGLYPLGLANQYFFSADYYPLLPWLFIFLSGYFLGRIFQNNHILKAGPSHSLFLAFCGRHSLWIYLLHQPIALAVIFMWNAFL